MRTDRWKRVESLFNAAMDLPADARSAYLQSACADDADLRAEVEALLAEDEAPKLNALADATLDAGGILKRLDEFGSDPLFQERFGERVSQASEADAPIPHIEGYRILDVIGEGGMGVVYRAEQLNPPRVVALKVMKAGASSARLRRRFEFEAQVLGRLQHAGIARIFEAGIARTSPDAEPRAYFAMELVSGSTLAQFAADRRLSLRQRLDLIARVCDAVEHAHQKGVIHRDLKPANILVDDAGEPKVLDFGVARTVDPDDSRTTQLTGVGQIIGTLPYMSPEQFSGDPGEVDTRADVYALGVNLFELLCGRLPHDLSRRSIAEAARIIRDDEPERLATLNRACRGDIDVIVHRALEKDKQRRYQSAAALAADLRRYLADELIEARRDSGWYLLRKAIARNRGAFTAAAAFMILLAASAISLGVLYREQTRERKQAESARDEANAARIAEADARQRAERSAEEARREGEKASRVLSFLMETLSHADPRRSANPDMTVREAMMHALRLVEDQELEAQPEIAAAVRLAIGDVMRSLAQYDAAEPLLRESFETRREMFGESSVPALEAFSSLAGLQLEAGRVREATPQIERALRLSLESLAPDHPIITYNMNNLAMCYQEQGRWQEALELHQRVLAARRRATPVYPENIALSLNNVAACLKYLHRLDEAEPLYREALELRRESQESSPVPLADILHNLGALLHARGRWDEAESLYREALEIREKSWGPDSAPVALTLNNLAGLLYEKGDFAEAEPLFRKALEQRRRSLPAAHPNVSGSLVNLGSVLSRLRRFDEAEAALREGLELRSRAYGPVHANVSHALIVLGRMLTDRGDFDEAEQVLTEAAMQREQNAASDPPGHIGAQLNLCEFHVRRRCEEDLPAVVERMTELLSLLEREVSAPPDRALMARHLLAVARWRLNPADAALAEEMIEICSEACECVQFPSDQRARIANRVADVWSWRGRLDEAEHWREIARAIDAPAADRW